MQRPLCRCKFQHEEQFVSYFASAKVDFPTAGHPRVVVLRHLVACPRKKGFLIQHKSCTQNLQHALAE